MNKYYISISISFILLLTSLNTHGASLSGNITFQFINVLKPKITQYQAITFESSLSINSQPCPTILNLPELKKGQVFSGESIKVIQDKKSNICDENNKMTPSVFIFSGKESSLITLKLSDENNKQWHFQPFALSVPITINDEIKNNDLNALTQKINTQDPKLLYLSSKGGSTVFVAGSLTRKEIPNHIKNKELPRYIIDIIY